MLAYVGFLLLQMLFSMLVPAITNTLSFIQERSRELDDKAQVPRIAYGAPADITEHPYFAILEGCGAAIISEEWLVTAAHCVLPHGYGHYEQHVTFVGSHTLENSVPVFIEEIVVHPQYTDLGFAIVNDIALIRLVKPLKFSDRIQPLELPDEKYELEDDSKHVFVGVGLDETGKPSKQLMKIDVNGYSTSTCYARYFGSMYWSVAPFMSWLDETTICARRVENLVGAGYGDSGSPMVKDNVLVGIASYIMLDNDCHSCHSRTLYLANVAHYVPWILSHTGKL
ncbi:chymotrypsin-2-like [Ostrinia furnacalis]|uniref:chymotrypsin-2-like n=1 Tax=Ostrinia furnacalis TaxID=93504 RepID=UPI001039196A|nr:chymotrypsin-2-like [Ostrinia furnacalis]